MAKNHAEDSTNPSEPHRVQTTTPSDRPWWKGPANIIALLSAVAAFIAILVSVHYASWRMSKLPLSS